jgi:hypothetical protein
MQRDTLVDPFEIAPSALPDARAKHRSRQRTHFDASKPNPSTQQTLIDPFERSAQHIVWAPLKDSRVNGGADVARRQ